MDMKKYIKTILLISWMCVIFYLSCEQKSDTIATTNIVIEILYGIYNIVFTKNPLDINTFSQAIFKPVRKIAHFSEFAILGILAYLVYNDEPGRNDYILPLVFSSLYAISDEIHQYFVPGRACTLVDVLIDTIGAFIGIMFIHLIKKRWQKKQL